MIKLICILQRTSEGTDWTNNTAYIQLTCWLALFETVYLKHRQSAEMPIQHFCTVFIL